MSENLISALSDKNNKPTDELIFSIIGDGKVLWHRIMDYATENYADVSGEWNCYNDGKKWLFKLTHKKKAIFWVALLNDTFRVTFWFGDKAIPFFEEAIIPPSVKDEFRNAKKYGAVRPVSIIVREQADADVVLSLIALKQKIR